MVWLREGCNLCRVGLVSKDVSHVCKVHMSRWARGRPIGSGGGKDGWMEGREGKGRCFVLFGSEKGIICTEL